MKYIVGLVYEEKWFVYKEYIFKEKYGIILKD